MKTVLEDVVSETKLNLMLLVELKLDLLLLTEVHALMELKLNDLLSVRYLFSLRDDTATVIVLGVSSNRTVFLGNNGHSNNVNQQWPP